MFCSTMPKVGAVSRRSDPLIWPDSACSPGAPFICRSKRSGPCTERGEMKVFASAVSVVPVIFRSVLAKSAATEPVTAA